VLISAAENSRTVVKCMPPRCISHSARARTVQHAMRCRLGLLVDSKEAERIGLVDVVLGADAVQAEAEKRLAELLKIPGSTATSPASPADILSLSLSLPLSLSPVSPSHHRTGGLAPAEALSTSLLQETAMQTRHA
jgi:hypothetical protein